MLKPLTFTSYSKKPFSFQKVFLSDKLIKGISKSKNRTLSFRKFYIFYINYVSSNNPVTLKTLTFTNRMHNPITLLLNYKRKRFFPSMTDGNQNTIWFISLGMLVARYRKSKNFIKKKLMYVKASVMIRKILIYSLVKTLTLVVKRIPIHLNEIVSVLFKPGITIHNHPFIPNTLVDDKTLQHSFSFSNLLFLNNKPYGFMKVKNKGRLKRKIRRKIVLKNRLLD